MRKIIIGLFFSFLFLGTAFASPVRSMGFTFTDSRAKSVRIPVEIQHNVVLIPLQINGSFEMNFILDTGVKTTILTESMLTGFIGLDSLRPIRLRGLGVGQYVDGYLARNVGITMPGIVGTGINMVVLPDGLISYSGMFGRPVYGIIGYEVFGQFVVEINYQHKYVELHNPFEYKMSRWKQKRFTTLPMKIKRFKPHIEASLTDGRGHKITRSWLIDTGASHALSLYDPKLPLPDPSVDAFLGMGLGGDVYGKVGRNAVFEMGDFVFEEIITGYPDSNSLYLPEYRSSWYGNIGSEVMSRFTVIFDYFHEEIHLRKNASYKDSFTYNTSGLEIITQGKDYDAYIISYVRPGSSAYQAGIRSNDQILTLNGLPAMGMDITEMYANLRRRGGRVVAVRLKRGDETFRTRFKVEDEI
jgi:hypothetical protein